jgi:phage repressor protein C with HTH and peptisase S24 domain
MTLEQMANLLDLQDKTSYYAYEQGKALPDVFKLLKLASYFDVSLEDIVNRNLSTKSTLKIPNTILYEIQKIPVSARAGYAASYGDAEWVEKRPTVRIPYKPYGIARAFEIAGDSMEPEIVDGSTVIAIKVDKTELRDQKIYVVVTSDGVQCKQIRVSDQENIIYLISVNTLHPPRHILKTDVLELWEVWKKIKPGETWELPGLGE